MTKNSRVSCCNLSTATFSTSSAAIGLHSRSKAPFTNLKLKIWGLHNIYKKIGFEVFYTIDGALRKEILRLFLWMRVFPVNESVVVGLRLWFETHNVHLMLLGPDEVGPVMLKRLGRNAMALLNLSFGSWSKEFLSPHIPCCHHLQNWLKSSYYPQRVSTSLKPPTRKIIVRPTKHIPSRNMSMANTW